MSRPVTRDLVMRDPALAALLGALPGADYGHEGPSGFRRPSYGADFGISSYDPSRNIGYGGMGFGVDAPPPPHPGMPMPPMPHPAEMLHPSHPAHPAHAGWGNPMYHGYALRHGHPAYWGGRYGYYGHEPPAGPSQESALMWANEMAETARRARLLDPNEHSRLKIERYSFSMSPATNFTIGTATLGWEATLQPNTRIRAQRVLMNAPAMNFVILSQLQIANVNVFVGTQEDAFTYSATAQGVMLDLPTLDPANRATAGGNYTGYIPPGFAAEFSYQFIITFQGPSTLVGGL